MMETVNRKQKIILFDLLSQKCIFKKVVNNLIFRNAKVIRTLKNEDSEMMGEKENTNMVYKNINKIRVLLM